MMTDRGIALDTYVMMDGNCPLTCEATGDQVQFEFGHRTGSLSLVTSEDGLARLVRIATEALSRLRAIPEGDEVSFSVGTTP